MLLMLLRQLKVRQDASGANLSIYTASYYTTDSVQHRYKDLLFLLIYPIFPLLSSIPGSRLISVVQS